MKPDCKTVIWPFKNNIELGAEDMNSLWLGKSQNNTTLDHIISKLMFSLLNQVIIVPLVTISLRSREPILRCSDIHLLSPFFHSRNTTLICNPVVVVPLQYYTFPKISIFHWRITNYIFLQCFMLRCILETKSRFKKTVHKN